MNLHQKKILFIGPKFHEYEVLIQNELELAGASVDFYAERSYKIDFTIINNFFKSHLANYQGRHYNKILKSINNNEYDYLFVIRGYKLTENFLQTFKRINPKSQMIMYQWDSEKTNPFSHIINFFNKVNSFDFEDCKNYNIEYLPLFFTRDITQYQNSSKTYEFDFFFMGVFFEERYQALIKFKDYCFNNGYKLKPFLFMPFTTRLKYLLKGKKLDNSIISFKHMDRKEYLEILNKSKVMVDVSNPNQTGLSMRVIEAMAIGTKVLTNNLNLKKDKYIGHNSLVYFFNEKAVDLNFDFINTTESVDSSKMIFTLHHWLEKLFDKNEN